MKILKNKKENNLLNSIKNKTDHLVTSPAQTTKLNLIPIVPLQQSEDIRPKNSNSKRIFKKLLQIPISFILIWFKLIGSLIGLFIVGFILTFIIGHWLTGIITVLVIIGLTIYFIWQEIVRIGNIK